MGGFKGLLVSDVYLQHYVSRKHWTVNVVASEEPETDIKTFKIEEGDSEKLYHLIDKSFYGKVEHWHVSESCDACSKCSSFLSECPVHLSYSDLKSADPNTCINCGVCADIVSGGICPKSAFYSEQQNSTNEDGSEYGSFDLDRQSTITIPGSRNLKESAIVISIPKKCFGVSIEEGSIQITEWPETSSEIKDVEGVLVYNGVTVGDVIYTKGLLIITDPYLVERFSKGMNYELVFTSTCIVYSYNVICKVQDREFNYSYNPSANRYQFKDPDFTPYVTSIGLYNNAGELLMVAKLSKPVRKLPSTDITFKIQIDV